MNRISTLMRGPAELPLSLSLGWGTERRRQSAAQNRVSSRTLPCGHLILDFQPLKLLRSEFLSVLLTEMFRQSSLKLSKTCPGSPDLTLWEPTFLSLRDDLFTQGPNRIIRGALAMG